MPTVGSRLRHSPRDCSRRTKTGRPGPHKARMCAVRWKVGLFRLWTVGSICWIAYWVWDQWPTEENELTCWRRLIGVEKGERCEFNTYKPPPASQLILLRRPL